MKLPVGKAVTFCDPNGLRKAQICQPMLEDDVADVAVYDDEGRLEYGVTDAPRAKSREELTLGQWWS